MIKLNLRTVLIVTLCVSVTSGSGVPIWELLTEQEKMSRLMYLFLKLVDSYCGSSPIPDCNKVLALYGVSNLVTQNEHTINQLDPFQRGARQLIWMTVMKGAFHMPVDNHQDNSIDNLNFDPTSHMSDGENYLDRNNIESYAFPDLQNDIGESDPHPYAVRVRPPKGFTQSPAQEGQNYQMTSQRETPKHTSNDEYFVDSTNQITNAKLTSNPSTFSHRTSMDNYMSDYDLMYTDDRFSTSDDDYIYDYSYEPLPQKKSYSNSPIIRIIPFKSGNSQSSGNWGNSASQNDATMSIHRGSRYNAINTPMPTYSSSNDRRNSDLLRILKR